MNTYKFKTNINCGSCIKSITPFLNDVDNIDHWKVNTDIPDKVLEVLLDDTNSETVIAAVTKAGFEITAL